MGLKEILFVEFTENHIYTAALLCNHIYTAAT